MSKTKTRPAAASAPAKQSKKAQLISLLRREGGASIAEITDATGWLPHTTRAMLTGLRKKGFSLEKQKVEGTTRYSITGEPAA